MKQAQTAIAAYESQSQGISSVGLAMPSGEDVAGALAEIQGIAANTRHYDREYCRVAPTIQLQAGAHASATSSSVLTKPLGSFTLKLTASGSYENFKNFLSEVETNIRIFDVNNVSLEPTAITVTAGTKPTASRDAFNYTVTVTAYYQTQ